MQITLSKKNLILFAIFCSFFLYFSTCFVAADIYQVNVSEVYYSTIYNGTFIYTIPNATVISSTYAGNGSVVDVQTMYLITNGSYAVNLTLKNTGDYLRQTDYFSSGILIGQSSEAIRIVTNINNISQDTTQMINSPWEPFILFAVGVILVWLAKYLAEPVIYFLASVFFLGSSAGMYFFGQGWAYPMFFALLGIVLIFKGIAEFIRDVDRANAAKRNEYVLERDE